MWFGIWRAPRKSLEVFPARSPKIDTRHGVTQSALGTLIIIAAKQDH